MIATTPEEWLPILARRLDARQPDIAVKRSYVNGEAPLPESGENVRAAWKAYQRKARTNYGGLAAKSLCNRIRAVSVTVGADDDLAVTSAARRIFRDNRLSVQLSDAVTDSAVTGIGYLLLGMDADGAVITAEKPELFIAAPDPLRPWVARAGAKIWRDVDQARDYALVWANGQRQEFSRSAYVTDTTTVIRTAEGGWLPTGNIESYQGAPPVAILDWENPAGFVYPHHDVIDRINLGKLQRLVIAAMQAFRQRALKKSNLPEGWDKDADGNDIDLAKVFEPSPGALWDLPEGIDIWESSTTDIMPLLEGEKADARDFAAVSGTPISVFIPDGANQSAEGAHNAKDQQISQAQDAIDRFKPAAAGIMVRALIAEGLDLAGATVDVQFAKPEHVSMSEKYAAAAQAKQAGESIKTIQRKILGYTPEEMAQAEQDLADEQLAAALAVQVAEPVAAPVAANANA
jgi:hypothetical protein